MSKNYVPCSYASYQGTRWHRRLVAGEFILQFDQYPEREVITDHVTEQLPHNEAWKDRIRTICTTDSETWNRLSPGALVEQLRKERLLYFPEAELHWRSSSFPSLSGPEARKRWHNTYEEGSGENKMGEILYSPIYVFPDIHDACPLEDQVTTLLALYRSNTAEEHNQIHNEGLDCYLDLPVIVCISETYKEQGMSIHHYPVQRMPDPTELGIEMMKDMGKSLAILCSDVWYALAFLKQEIPVHSFLDRREWFTSVVLHDNIPDNSPTTIPEQSWYGELLQTEEENNRALREYRLLDHIPSNGVEADLAQEVVIPQWVSQATRDDQLTLDRGFYKRTDDTTWIQTEQADANTVHVASAFFQKKHVMMEPVFFAGKHSPLSLSYPDGGFFTSFNYYFTENLKNWYASRDRRTIPWDDFMVDYLAIAQGEDLYESVPLYNKALLGYGKDGTVFACEGRWESITLTLDGNKTFVFEKEDLCVHDFTLKQGENHALPTRNTSEIHFPSDTKTVGEGRWCLTFIHDYLWDASEGPVQVPPFGVVVTIDEKIEQVKKASWSVQWRDLPIDKSDVAWLVGGFNLLLQERKNLVGTQEQAHAQLEKEGWFTPSSLMTQETALDVTGIQPRSVIGTCGDKIMVMSVSGRNSKSQGISFSDAASLAMHLTQERQEAPLEFLLNLDGGASSVLGCKKDGEASCLLTKPSPSITNPAGCARCVPSLLTIKLKQNRDEGNGVE
ncbi:MAG: phosphodiester glycosidase family protein [Sphaerochaeta sp.]|nr:phosphodiester glycosidase family protein [Sphaerochaeta sp.]